MNCIFKNLNYFILYFFLGWKTTSLEICLCQIIKCLTNNPNVWSSHLLERLNHYGKQKERKIMANRKSSRARKNDYLERLLINRICQDMQPAEMTMMMKYIHNQLKRYIYTYIKILEIDQFTQTHTHRPIFIDITYTIERSMQNYLDVYLYPIYSIEYLIIIKKERWKLDVAATTAVAVAVSVVVVISLSVWYDGPVVIQRSVLDWKKR